MMKKSKKGLKVPFKEKPCNNKCLHIQALLEDVVKHPEEIWHLGLQDLKILVGQEKKLPPKINNTIWRQYLNTAPTMELIKMAEKCKNSAKKSKILSKVLDRKGFVDNEILFLKTQHKKIAVESMYHTTDLNFFCCMRRALSSKWVLTNSQIIRQELEDCRNKFGKILNYAKLVESEKILQETYFKIKILDQTLNYNGRIQIN